ncbi:hypothetical protein F5Y19DRAFT_480815 [Xylariaceae sp. FL1651]|nr:hypothetical protein F5Y19DRAFT_480815 [Xylariaceae sp. FL1651]
MSALVLTNATRLRFPIGDQDLTVISRHGSESTRAVGGLQRHSWDGIQFVEVRYIKRYDGDDGDDGDGGDNRKGGKGKKANGHDEPTPQPTSDSSSHHRRSSSTPHSSHETTSTLSSISISSTNSVPTTSSTLTTSSTISIAPVGVPTDSSTPLSGGGDVTGSADGSSSNDTKINDDNGYKHGNYGNTSILVIAGGIIGGLLVALLSLSVWYWFVMRPKRREQLSQESPVLLTKDADLESHVTVDLRNGPPSPHNGPHNGGGFGDGSSNYTMSPASAFTPTFAPVPAPVPVATANAARNLSGVPASPSSRAAYPKPYPASQPQPVASSLATSHSAFMDEYAAPSLAYSQTPSHPHPYPGPLPGAMSTFPLPLGTSTSYSISQPPSLPGQEAHGSSPLQAHPVHLYHNSLSTARELDGPPPPRYPDAIASSSPVRSPSPSPSPISPLPVSPISASSPHPYSHSHLYSTQLPPHLQSSTAPSLPVHPQYQRQQQQQQKQQQYGNSPYEPPALPEVVSPIYQLGQTSATLLEYDESAETAGMGQNNVPTHNQQHHHRHSGGGDEKQAVPSQQPMSRY